MFIGYGVMGCLGVIGALGLGTLGGLVSAALYHLCLLILGAARGGFEATYRAVAFGMGSVYLLSMLPILGFMNSGLPPWAVMLLLAAWSVFTLVVHLVVMSFAFQGAHGAGGVQAFFGSLLPLVAGGCFLGAMVSLSLPALIHMMKVANVH
jgi:hypothetical protein